MEPSEELCAKYIKAVISPEEMIELAVKEYGEDQN
jgi:hypothetical protein